MKTYGKSPLVAMMEVIQRNKIAQEAKKRLNAHVRNTNEKRKDLADNIDSVLPGQTIEWLPLSKHDMEIIDMCKCDTESIAAAYNVPVSLLNTDEHSKTFKK